MGVLHGGNGQPVGPPCRRPGRCLRPAARAGVRHPAAPMKRSGIPAGQVRLPAVGVAEAAHLRADFFGAREREAGGAHPAGDAAEDLPVRQRVAGRRDGPPDQLHPALAVDEGAVGFGGRRRRQHQVRGAVGFRRVDVLENQEIGRDCRRGGQLAQQVQHPAPPPRPELPGVPAPGRGRHGHSPDLFREPAVRVVVQRHAARERLRVGAGGQRTDQVVLRRQRHEPGAGGVGQLGQDREDFRRPVALHELGADQDHGAFGFPQQPGGLTEVAVPAGGARPGRSRSRRLDAVQQAAEQAGFAARRRLQPDLGEQAVAVAMRIHGDEADPLLERPPQGHPDHRASEAGIQTHGQDDLGRGQGRQRHAPAQEAEVGVERRPVEDPGRGVHLVGAHDHPGELLGDVQVLGAAVGGCQQGELLRRTGGELLGHQRGGLVPGDFRGDRAVAGIGVPEPPVAADQLRVAEAPLDAELPLVHHGIVGGQAPDDPFVLHQQPELTAHAAERAGGGLLPVGLALPGPGFLAQGAGRAHRHAGAAELAAARHVGAVEGRPDDGVAPAVLVRQHVGGPDLLAHPDTPPAEDAQVVIAVVEGILRLHPEVAVVDRVIDAVDAHGFRHRLQLAQRVLGAVPAARGDPGLADGGHELLALGLLVADQAAGGVLRQEELQDVPAHGLDLGGPGAHDHPLFHRGGAGGGKGAHPLDLDDAHAATAVRRQAVEIAQGGDLDAVGAGRLQDRGAPGGGDRPVVDAQRDGGLLGAHC